MIDVGFGPCGISTKAKTGEKQQLDGKRMIPKNFISTLTGKSRSFFYADEWAEFEGEK